MRPLLAGLGAAAVLVPAIAAAQGTGGAPDPGTPPGPLYDASFRILFKLFVIAAVLEQALALLFNWKPFRKYLDERATKPLVAFLTAAFLVWWFHLNPLSELLRLYGADGTGGTGAPTDGVVSGALTALILGGGSSAVNNLLTTLGLRPVREPAVVARPPATAAWISVQVSRVASVGTLTVLAQDTAGALHTLGTLDPSPAMRHFSFFLRDRGRFPPQAGHLLAPSVWSILVQGKNRAGAPVASPAWDPYQVDAGSIIDLTLVVKRHTHSQRRWSRLRLHPGRRGAGEAVRPCSPSIAA